MHKRLAAFRRADSVWRWYEIATDKPCIYAGPGRSALDRFSYSVRNGFTCEYDLRPRKPKTILGTQARVDLCEHRQVRKCVDTDK